MMEFMSSMLRNKTGTISLALAMLATGGAYAAAPSAGLPTVASYAKEKTDDFKPTRENAAVAPKPAPEGMVWIPGGEFSMGEHEATDAGVCGLGETTLDARPVHRTRVSGFWMDVTTVTNAAFEKFVAATGYVTVAERKPDPKDFPGVPPEALVPGSLVFTAPAGAVALDDVSQWWRYVPGADWRHPTGPGSDIKGKGNLPVTQVAFADAQAYAAWEGKRLPTEAEWEFAARGGLAGKLYFNGDDLKPGGKFIGNIFEGKFPYKDTGEDGFAGIAPVASYPANRYGLYDMAGNVWQWCADKYRPDYYAKLAAAGIADNPRGPESSLDPDEPGADKRVQRGGSFLCTDQYCTRYRVGARGKGEISTGSNHLGFRCVASPVK